MLYQTFVFVSRSSLSILHLPPLPLALLPVPTVLQLAILSVTLLESSTSFLVDWFGEAGATWVTIALVCCEGLCGGAAYVNCFYRLGTALEPGGGGDDDVEGQGVVSTKGSRRREQEKEFVSSLSLSLSLCPEEGVSVEAEKWLLENRECRVRRHEWDLGREFDLFGVGTAVVRDPSRSRERLLSRIVINRE